MTKLNGWKMSGAVLILCVATIAAQAQTFTNLFDFDYTDGGSPNGPMAQGRDGNLYGTAAGGPRNGGVVFNMTTSGVESVIYNSISAQGIGPQGLVLGTDGNFYGVTGEGGKFDLGTIFKVAPNGNGVSLYSFTGGSDGSTPVGPPIQAIDGNFYGTTNAGTVYKITTTGIFTLLTTLPGPSISSLIQAKDGNFYGTSYFGGTADEGTVFKMTPEGNVHILHSFTGPDGAFPVASVIEVGGNLYGTTQAGGAYNDGVIFRLTPEGITVLHNFGDPNYPNDGIQAYAGLLEATDGNFYGTTVFGGGVNQTCGNGCGVIFQLTSSGGYSILHDFEGPDGTWANSTPSQHTNGEIYGLSTYGGATSQGVVWNLNMGLQPFVGLVSKSAKVGQTGGILGQGFTGTTAVSLNGTPMTFNVLSDTYLRATVPTGATTGYVTVTTLTGILTSNVPFQVIP
jgi:uncharacterized repeat protein (TIGR03803 family)